MPRRQTKRGSRSGRTGASRRSRGSSAAAQAARIASLEEQLRAARAALASRAARKSPAKKAPAKKAPAKKAPAKKSAKRAARFTVESRRAPAKKAPAKKSPKRAAAALRAPYRDEFGRFAPRPAPARKAPAKKAPAKKAPAKKVPAKKAPAKKAPARRAPAKKAARAAERRVYRNEQGRFVTRSEYERASEIRRVEREFAEKQRAEQELRSLLYPIDGSLYARLSKVIGKVARAIEESNLDLSAVRQQEAYGSLFDATVDVDGLAPLDDLSDLRELANKESVIESAILAAYEVIEKAGVKRGFQLQLQLQPKESIILQYKRDRPIMSTRWMRLDERTEIDKLVVRARELLAALARNDWDTRHIKFSFRYDREVAVRG